MTNEGFNKTYIVMNKQHVDYKNIDNRRFPNRNIMRHVSPPSVVTVLDQIEFILDKVLTDNIKKDIDRKMNIKYNNLLSNSDNYNEEYDIPFKFSVYDRFNNIINFNYGEDMNLNGTTEDPDYDSFYDNSYGFTH